MRVTIPTLPLLLDVTVGLAACGTPAPQPTPTPEPPTSSFDLEKLIVDVFDPQPGEKVLVMTDVPQTQSADCEGGPEQREMAVDWQATFQQLERELGISVYPLLTYPATGTDGGRLPKEGEMGSQPVALEEILAETNIVVALTGCGGLRGDYVWPAALIQSIPGAWLSQREGNYPREEH